MFAGSRIAFVILLVAVAVPCVAHAQSSAPEASATTPSPSAEDRERARAAFVAGATAIDEGRWADAVDLFREAYDLSGSSVARFNLGYAYRALGRFREARDAFDSVLAGTIDDASRAETQALRDEVAGRIAALELTGVDETMHVRIDSRDLDPAPGPLVLELDPGSHAASVRATGFEVWEWAGTLAAGSHTSVSVSLVSLPTASSGGGLDLVQEPWFWIVLGVVVLGGAAVAIWAVDDAQQLRPEATVLRL